MPSSIYEIQVKTPAGVDITLSQHRGKVLLIVNTASRCGFTPQYAGLQVLHERYAERGFSVLAFPCNQFGAQEPGSDEQIGEFVRTHYGISFPVHAKIDVNGATAHPLYRYLKQQRGGVLGKAIKWNFTKFLVDAKGQVVKRYAPHKSPDSLARDIEKLLG